MKSLKLGRIGIILLMLIALTVSIFANSTDTVQYTTYAFAALFGSIAITQEYGTTSPVIFDTVLEDWVGGATLNRARLTGFLSVKAGALLYISNGLAEVIKTATVISGGTATAIRVNKSHLFIVGNIVMLQTGGAASTITAIDTSNAAYDVITIDATLGSTPVTGDVLVEAAAATVGTDSVAKYTANAVLKETTDLERANPGISGVVRGTVRSVALPYGAFADDVAALSLIRFN